MKPLGRSLYQEPVKWIAPPGVSTERGCVFRARRIFSHEDLAGADVLHIAAESYYVLYVNGALVGKGPARATRVCNFLDSYQIAPHLRAGDNTIAVEVFCNNFPTFLASPAEPALFISIGRWTTDESWQVQRAAEHRSAEAEVYTLQIGLTERLDLRQEPLGWQVGNDTGNWQEAFLLPTDCPIYAKAMYRRDVAFLRETRLLPRVISVVKGLEPYSPEDTDVATLLSTEVHLPCQLDASPLTRGEPLETGANITFIYDFGQEFIGHLDLEIEAPAGTILDVGYEEALQSGRLQLAPAHYRFADRYILRDGRQRISNALRWRGGRYVQLALRGSGHGIRIHHVHILDRRYPITESAAFSCDHEPFNDLWSRCHATLSACVTDTVMDCPWREMAFWVNDFLVVNRYWLQMVGRTDLLRRSLALALGQREPSGFIGGVCPTNENPFFTLFATNMFLPMVLQDYLIHTGDRATVDLFIDEALDLVEQCEKCSTAQGLLCPPEEQWNFVDWSFHFVGQRLEGKNTCVVNWFYVHALKGLSALYAHSQPARAKELLAKARFVAGQIDKSFWDEEQQCYREWLTSDGEDPAPLSGKLTHAMALLSGLAHPDYREATEAALTRSDLHPPELYMMHFVFEALLQFGRLDEVVRLINLHWGSILETDSPTIWEANVYEHGKNAYSNTGSLCHAFALAPVNIFQRYILGITPLVPGFRRFRVHPQMGDLAELRGSVPTPAGFIELECRRDGAWLFLRLSVPAQCVGVLEDGREFSEGEHQFQILLPEESSMTFRVRGESRETPQLELAGSL